MPVVIHGIGRKRIQEVLINKGVIMEKYSFKNVSGDILKGHIWKINKPKGNIIIITGMEEHSGRYDDFARFFNDNGYNVVCVDHYGQGENVDDLSKLSIVPSSFFSRSVKNIDDLVKIIKKNKLPTYLFAHSMGSFMAQDYIQRFSTHVDKIVLCGTNGPNAKLLFKLGFRIAKLVVTRKNHNNKGTSLQKLAIGSYSRAIKNRKTDSDWLSYNEDNVKVYLEDPKCGYGSTNGFYYEFLKGNARLFNKKFLKKISSKSKIFIIGGEEDPVGAYGKGPKKLYELYKTLGVQNVELKIYKNMRHEIHNETDKIVVYKDILNFFNN